jgi:hypothetical protein
MTMFVQREPALAMMPSVYVTLGISCCWQPKIHRRIVPDCFHGMVGFAHAGLMAVQAFRTHAENWA